MFMWRLSGPVIGVNVYGLFTIEMSMILVVRQISII